MEQVQADNRTPIEKLAELLRGYSIMLNNYQSIFYLLADDKESLEPILTSVKKAQEKVTAIASLVSDQDLEASQVALEALNQKVREHMQSDPYTDPDVADLQASFPDMLRQALGIPAENHTHSPLRS